MHGDSSRIKARLKQKKEQTCIFRWSISGIYYRCRIQHTPILCRKKMSQVQEKHNTAMDLAFISFYS